MISLLPSAAIESSVSMVAWPPDWNESVHSDDLKISASHRVFAGFRVSDVMRASAQSLQFSPARPLALRFELSNIKEFSTLNWRAVVA